MSLSRLWLGLLATACFGQNAVLEDFATRRLSHDSTTFLFKVFTSEDPNQVDLGISNGIWRIQGDTNSNPAQGCYTGCGIYWDINLYPYSTYPASWAQGYVKSGTFSSAVNRLQYKFMCSLAGGATSIPARADGGSGFDIGTYVKSHNNTSDGADQGQHYYHGQYSNIYSNHWLLAEINAQPNHQVGTAGQPLLDPEWFAPTQTGSGVQNSPVHYMDGLTRFYFDTQASGNLNGAAWANSVCSFKDFQFRTVTGEPERLVSTTIGTYSGTGFEVGFNSLANVNQVYNVRYSRSSLHTSGFGSGTDGGTVASPNSDYVGVKWASPAMPLSGGLYVGIQPQGGDGSFTEVFIPAMDTTTLAINTTSLPGGTTGVAYSQTVTASGGTTPYNWSITSGSLPPGLDMPASTGVISGTPTTVGTYNFTVQVLDAASATATQALSIVITGPAPTLALSSGSLTFGSQNLNTTSSVQPLTLSNTGTGAGTISSIAISGANASEFGSTDNCPRTTGAFGAGATCTINVTFTPTSAGSRSATITATDTPDSKSAAATLTGTGLDPTAVGLVQTVSCGPKSWPGTCTITGTTAGNLIAVAFSAYNGSTTPVINSITDNATGGSNSYSGVAAARSINTAGGQASWNEIWYARSVRGGATTLTITPSATQTGDVQVWELANVSTVAAAGAKSSQAATATPTSPALTTAAGKTAIVAVLHPGATAGGSTGVGSPWTDDSLNDNMAWAHYFPTAAGTYTAQWSTVSAVYASSAVAFGVTAASTQAQGIRISRIVMR